MRDLLFKNLTSGDRKRKIISSSEIVDKQGIRSVIHRHFVCLVKEIEGVKAQKPLPYVYVLKEHNNTQEKQKFFCKIKGSMYTLVNGKLFLLLYMHSLKINLAAIPNDCVGQGNKDFNDS